MKVERLSANKVKFSITIDELEDKGLLDNDQWRESLIWHDLFEEMLDEIQDLYGLDSTSAVTVEIHSLNSNEMTLIVTLDIEDLYEDDYVTVIEKKTPIHQYIFEFDSIEDVISLSHRMKHIEDQGVTSLYYKEGHYYLIFHNWDSKLHPVVGALGCEYGRISCETVYVLEEYGKVILKNYALKKITSFFSIE
ncbi:adapter protein MecA 1/2 [Bacillus pakistanensis]|uniref:Adapter protein MecA 1/2 n=1 Tax=Rossellomorea pakistanensis TaxID=992288 RepID=A0ABS2N932_9BACI|nr:adaptor protein MecA [Bacillus pakistanensis]MBM7584377.1 adapter protein MecA 1/2 [Bacillus pakistanensis]